MADRHITEIKFENLNENHPNIISTVGQIIISGDYKIDDTIGPRFNIVLKGKDAKKNKDLVLFSEVVLRLWDAPQNRLISEFYRRRLGECFSSGKETLVFRRYRNSFRNFELKLLENEGRFLAYVGNPELFLQPGDHITAEILSPGIIDPKKSEISLEVVELRGHIGPKRIPIAKITTEPFNIANWTDEDYIAFYAAFNNENIEDLKKRMSRNMREMIRESVQRKYRLYSEYMHDLLNTQ